MFVLFYSSVASKHQAGSQDEDQLYVWPCLPYVHLCDERGLLQDV